MGNNKSATNKFMGDDLRQRRKGNGNKEKYKEGKDRKDRKEKQ